MTIAKALNWATQRLKKKKILSARLDAELLLRNILHLSREELYTHLSQSFTFKQQERYNSLVGKRLERFPLAYITGKKEFMALEFFVNKNVMIPRPETELLVETVIKISHQSSVISHQSNRLPITDYRLPVIVDLGTGCGSIAITLAKYLPDVFIYAIDNAKKALSVARRNANYHGVKERIKFLLGDLFSPLQKYKLQRKIDVVVSNPPYIRSGDFSELAPEIRYEPCKALDGGKNGLNYYRKIIPSARAYLKRRGMLALEIGGHQKQRVVCLMKSEGYDPIRTYKDYAGINRIVVGCAR